MSDTLTIAHSSVAYGDSTPTSNPKRRHFDWSVLYQAISCHNPTSIPYFIDPGATKSIFSGQRTTSIDNTTAFAISQNPIETSQYRFTSTGGTPPDFRTDRGVDLSSVTLAVTVNASGMGTFTAPSGTPFSGVQVGDIVFIPGLTTGDSASPFSLLNLGYWQVIAQSDTVLQCIRPDGQFSGVGESVTVASAIQFQVFSSDGLQPGDKVEISGGFSTFTQRTYAVTAVNPLWFEVVSTTPIALESNVTPDSGLIFYTSGKKWIRVEADQECAAQLNGCGGQANRITPIVPGDEDQTGWMDKFGSVWSLSIVNRSSVTLSVTVFSVE